MINLSLIHIYNVVGVVSQPDRYVGRKKVLTMPDVKVEALKYDIPVIQPVKIKEDYQDVYKRQNQFFDVKVYDYNKSQYLTAYHIKLNNVKSKQLKVTVQRSSSTHLSYSPCQIVDFKVSDQQKDYSYKENIGSYSYISDVIGYKEYQLFLNPHIQHYDIDVYKRQA